MTTGTIFAPATSAVPAGVAIIRISGPDAGAALERLTGQSVPVPRVATRVRIADALGELIDDGLALWFPAPRSFTGENVAELHIHGGRAVVSAVLDALSDCPGLTPAEPGAFSRRAFENGKFDLTAAEGLADLVAAETSAQRRQAFRQMRGDLGRLYESWRSRLLGALAHLEATIDFSDEELPEGLEAGVSAAVAAVRTEVEAHLDDGHQGERLRDGIHLAIIGPPNAGKSSLLNLLARREAAIVSDIAGTTRDVIEVHLDLDGYPVVVADTAGLRDTDGEIEREGVRRARSRAAEVDVRIAVYDGAVWPTIDSTTRAMMDDATIAVVNKCDLGKVSAPVDIDGHSAFAISALTGEGVESLMTAIHGVIQECFEGGTGLALTRVRHRTALESGAEALRRFEETESVELAAEELRLATRALGRITGRVDVEEMLDVIFRDFCIGK